MAQEHEAITPDLAAFIAEQPLFFVTTAPLSEDGHLNLSPKGLDSLRVLGPHHVAYLDLTGSGNESAAHLHENGRITLLFSAFAGAPRILRLYGRGTVVLPESEGWSQLAPHFPPHPGSRQIISVTVSRVRTSCGFGVPRMEYVEPRDTLLRWAEAKGDEGLEQYRAEKNRLSLDGLPAPHLTGNAEVV